MSTIFQYSLHCALYAAQRSAYNGFCYVAKWLCQQLHKDKSFCRSYILRVATFVHKCGMSQRKRSGKRAHISTVHNSLFSFSHFFLTFPFTPIRLCVAHYICFFSCFLCRGVPIFPAHHFQLGWFRCFAKLFKVFRKYLCT